VRWTILLLIAACSGTVHTGGMSVAGEQARQKRWLETQCSVLTGFRQQTCHRLGPPRAPERHNWATASWWLYESRTWETGPRVSDYKIGAQIVCTSYVAFDGNNLVESDEQCRRVKSYVPWPQEP
jgi:hypothetical protein